MGAPALASGYRRADRPAQRRRAAHISETDSRCPGHCDGHHQSRWTDDRRVTRKLTHQRQHCAHASTGRHERHVTPSGGVVPGWPRSATAGRGRLGRTDRRSIRPLTVERSRDWRRRGCIRPGIDGRSLRAMARDTPCTGRRLCGRHVSGQRARRCTAWAWLGSDVSYADPTVWVAQTIRLLLAAGTGGISLLVCHGRPDPKALSTPVGMQARHGLVLVAGCSRLYCRRGIDGQIGR